MQTMDFQSFSSILRSKKARNFIIVGVASTALIVGGSLAWMSATKQPELIGEPALQCDPAWLLQTTPDRDYSREQIKLFLSNQDPTACNSQGLLWAETNREALRMLGEAAVNVRSAKHPCFNQSMSACLDSFKSNIQKEWEKAKFPGDRARIIIRFLAVEKALDSVEGGQPIAAGETGDALFLQLIEKSRLDRRSANATTPDGIAAEARRQAQLEREAQRDAEQGFSFGEGKK